MTPEVKSSGRRAFVARMWRAVLLAAGTGALGVAFWDRKGPGGKGSKPAEPAQLDYSVSAQAGKLAVARGVDRMSNVKAAIQALGGMGGYVRPGDKVLLKVNAAFATPPAIGATTHPDVVRQVALQCFEAGAGQVVVADNPINDPASCFSLSGIETAARKVGAQVMLPRPDRFEPYSLKDGRLILNWPVFSAPMRWADKVIGLAPVKDHHRSGASLGIKNWYGLLGGRRNIFHQQIHTIIADLAMLVKPTLVILDGTWSMMANGPTGGSIDDLKATRTVVAGTDPVAVDAFGATLLGKTAKDLPHLKMAQAAGAGTVDFRSLNPIEVNAQGS
jgi:uncharacterized protein (DUF362 family)